MGNNGSNFSTGLLGLDKVIRGLKTKENVVWRIDNVEDYKPFVNVFCKHAHEKKQKVVYFRFAQHIKLLHDNNSVKYIQLHPQNGFEMFINEIFNVIENTGNGAYYVFDCLSELLVDWYSDRMLSNFFILTCQCLKNFDTVSYFALMRSRHSSHATEDINDNAHIIIDIYRNDKKIYIHPIKVFKRHTKNLNTLHIWEGDDFFPVTSSATVSAILADVPQPWLDFTVHRLGGWTSTFARANEAFVMQKDGNECAGKIEKYYKQIMRMVVTRDNRIMKLAEKYFNLGDLLEIRKRMIGTGLIGGKSVGMLLARSILKKVDPKWKKQLEAHDSFFIGSDVFYTYLVQNDCWWLRRKQKSQSAMLEEAKKACLLMLNGHFPKYIRHQFMEMLNYFGQVPIIVRSSSLLEDNFGNSFSGKYESVFCTNQGNPAERLEAFVKAVLVIYTSTMNEDALTYRTQRGLIDNDEQMGLLVQRVSGNVCGDYFFPQIAGVGYSFNPYVWNKDINPNDGLLRLVFGLGTRAVDRHDDDYTRIVALNVPEKRPEANFDEVRKYAQRKVDVLDLKKNIGVDVYFEDVVKLTSDLSLDMFASRDYEVERRASSLGMEVFSWVLTFDKLFSETSFIKQMREMLKILSDAYDYPVDIEYAMNFLDDGSFRINLLQCRPFQIKKGQSLNIKKPNNIKKDDIIFEISGQILGHSVNMPIAMLIYVIPSKYSLLSQSDRYAVARLIGKLTHQENAKPEKIMLFGPGRWGTTSPSLGVPVTFTEINTVSVLCEIALMHDGLIPDISLGTHFYNDLVEMNMIYLGILPGRNDVILNDSILTNAPNMLLDILPEEERWIDIIMVVRGLGKKGSSGINLHVNSLKQEAVCYRK